MKNKFSLRLKGHFLILFLIFTNVGFSQTADTIISSPKLLKNSVHGSVAFSPLNFTSSYSGMYDRLLLSINKTSDMFLFARVGVGLLVDFWTPGGGPNSFFTTQVGILTGPKKHHLEISAGIYFTKERIFHSPICGYVGYRFQKPGGNFIFRTGLGVPENLYIGCGLSF